MLPSYMLSHLLVHTLYSFWINRSPVQIHKKEPRRSFGLSVLRELRDAVQRKDKNRWSFSFLCMTSPVLLVPGVLLYEVIHAWV